MEIINSRKNSDKNISRQPTAPPIKTENKEIQVEPNDFKENYNDKLRKEKLKIYSNHDISFLLK